MKKIFILIIVSLLITGCNNKKRENIYKEDETCDKPYTQKAGYSITDDGWIYVIENNFGCKGDYLSFDGYNMKYKKLENYYTRVHDQYGNITKDYSGYAALILTDSTKEYAEVKNIGKFLTEKKFSKSITKSDLEELKLEELNLL